MWDGVGWGGVGKALTVPRKEGGVRGWPSKPEARRLGRGYLERRGFWGVGTWRERKARGAQAGGFRGGGFGGRPGWRGWGWPKGLGGSGWAGQDKGEGKEAVKGRVRGWGLEWRGEGVWGGRRRGGVGCSGWDEYGGWGWHLGYLNNLNNSNNLNNVNNLNNLNPAHLNDVNYLLFKSGQRI